MFGLVNRSGTLIHGQMRVLFKGWKIQKKPTREQQKPTRDECVTGIHIKQNAWIVILDGDAYFLSFLSSLLDAFKILWSSFLFCLHVDLDISSFVRNIRDSQ